MDEQTTELQGFRNEAFATPSEEEGCVELIRMSPFTGEFNCRIIKATLEQLIAYGKGQSGPVQQAFPNLDANEREFIMTGITPVEWDSMTEGIEL